MFGDIVKTIAAPVIGAVGGFLGQQSTNQENRQIAEASNAASAEQAARQMEFQAQQTKQQMDFQERTRANQYQVATQDMRAAGLNPMLAYTQGGAGSLAGSAGTGAMGQVTTARVGNSVGSALAGAQALSMNQADIDLKKASTAGTAATTLKTEADTIRTAAEIGNILQTTKLNTQQEKNLVVNLDKLLQEIKNLRATEGLTSAQTGKTFAEEKNIRENIAPSVDPFWYRDIKKNIPTPGNLENFIKRKYLQYKGQK
jgi:hypothetical protein